MWLAWLTACRRRIRPWVPCNNVSCSSRAIRSRSAWRSCRRARTSWVRRRLRRRMASRISASSSATQAALNHSVWYHIGAMRKLRVAATGLHTMSWLAATTSKR
ncbi:hypothetical protein D3C81_1932600 [compost metagenome]